MPSSASLQNCLPAKSSVEAWLEQTQTPSALTRKRKREDSLTAIDPDSFQYISERMAGQSNMLADLELPVTPSKSTSTETTFNTTADSKADSSAALKIPKDVSWVSRRMVNHKLLFGNRDAFNRYPQFKKRVMHIIDGDRTSEPGELSAKKFEKAVAYFETANEDTILNQLLPLIIKSQRAVPLPVENTTVSQDEEEQQITAQEYTMREWVDDGLVVKTNDEFRRTLIPNAYAETGMDLELAKAMAKVDGMKNPKPDRIFGLDCDIFEPPSDFILTAETNAHLDIVRLVHHAFLIIEGKSADGSLAVAENQARRGGATLVHAERLLRARVGEQDVVGADDRTFVFSATMSSKMMEIWVHWAEVTENGPFFHMNRVASKSLGDGESNSLGPLRRNLHNILSWGLIGRFEQLKTLHTRIHAHEKAKLEQMVQDSNEVKSGKKRRLGLGTLSS